MAATEDAAYLVRSVPKVTLPDLELSFFAMYEQKNARLSKCKLRAQQPFSTNVDVRIYFSALPTPLLSNQKRGDAFLMKDDGKRCLQRVVASK